MNNTMQFTAVERRTMRDEVLRLKERSARLVQIGATRLAESVELTYSFEVTNTLTNLRLLIPADGASVPSITSIYWCAFLYENEIHDLFNVHFEGLQLDFKGNLYTTAVKFPFSVPPAAKAAGPEKTVMTAGVPPSVVK